MATPQASDPYDERAGSVSRFPCAAQSEEVLRLYEKQLDVQRHRTNRPITKEDEDRALDHLLKHDNYDDMWSENKCNLCGRRQVINVVCLQCKRKVCCDRCLRQDRGCVGCVFVSDDDSGAIELMKRPFDVPRQALQEHLQHRAGILPPAPGHWLKAIVVSKNTRIPMKTIFSLKHIIIFFI